MSGSKLNSASGTINSFKRNGDLRRLTGIGTKSASGALRVNFNVRRPVWSVTDCTVHSSGG
jgi:hypothetical protein